MFLLKRRWPKTKVFTIKSIIGLGFKLNFVPNFIFPCSHPSLPSFFPLVFLARDSTRSPPSERRVLLSDHLEQAITDSLLCPLGKHDICSLNYSFQWHLNLAGVRIDCEQSLTFRLNHSRSRARVRGERRSPPFFHKICIGLLFRSPRVALRKEGRPLTD